MNAFTSTPGATTPPFTFSGRDIARHRSLDRAKPFALFEAMTSKGVVMRMLCIAPDSRTATRCVKDVMEAKSVSTIDAAFSAMKVTIVETIRDGVSTLEVCGALDAVPAYIRETIDRGVESPRPVLPTALDKGAVKTLYGEWNSDTRRQYNFKRMLHALGMPFSDIVVPTDPSEFDKRYDEVKKAYDTSRDQGNLVPSNKQISFARAIHQVTGIPYGFDLGTASRQEVSQYIGANRSTWQDMRPGKA